MQLPLSLVPVVWMPSHRAPFVLWLSSLLSLVVTLFSLAGVGLFSLLGVRLILRVFFPRGPCCPKEWTLPGGPLQRAPSPQGGGDYRPRLAALWRRCLFCFL